MNIDAYKDRYPTSFVVPRQSRHTIRQRIFLPAGKIRQSLDGLAVWPHIGSNSLLHAFNRVPLGHPRYVISFESDLPRTFGSRPDSLLRQFLIQEIASKRCRRLIGLSHWAKANASAELAGNPHSAHLQHKMMVRYPNVTVPNTIDPLAEELSASKLDKVILTFAGAHFARKGGCVAVRVAEEALKRGLPIHVNVVSTMNVGKDVWTDPVNPQFIEPYRRLLDLPNVRYFAGLPNSEVRALFGQSHFTLLPTFSDTFGYSIIEGMAEHTPTIATAVQAIPEFVVDGVNGLLLDLNTDSLGNWISPPYSDRHLPSYEAFYRNAIEELVEQLLRRIEPLLDQPKKLLAMRLAARTTATSMFSPQVSSNFYDDFYERVRGEDIQSVPVLNKGLDSLPLTANEILSPRR